MNMLSLIDIFGGVKKLIPNEYFGNKKKILFYNNKKPACKILILEAKR